MSLHLLRLPRVVETLSVTHPVRVAVLEVEHPVFPIVAGMMGMPIDDALTGVGFSPIITDVTAVAEDEQGLLTSWRTGVPDGLVVVLGPWGLLEDVEPIKILLEQRVNQARHDPLEGFPRVPPTRVVDVFQRIQGLPSFFPRLTGMPGESEASARQEEEENSFQHNRTGRQYRNSANSPSPSRCSLTSPR